ncbi:alanine--tRNA ligase [Candidatus Pacearchaeota archaeon CG_4_9_14_0_2_um_filter_39_13]|nr:alanine--tRNA ligase [Candidatus Pacearchaeota archaeon]OIO43922.1 MAG: alanine--tRNA ligase [Candidatus Pacearchaeota archaeon CG1_02_39_14]PJC44773.1 MAG: alanine--tRNA ligase [Candidatus Pacearchaeota archaeon CG_4_9_14_0_2_um_filter_39_13]
MITREELIKKYLNFFKKNNHKEIPSASLIPENDPTVLFTTAGMHPLVPYLTGQKHPLGKRLASVQKCIRTGDIGDIGDTTHHTFFEMLGNWSLGDYWKKEAISFSFDFLTKELKIPIEKLAVTCFKGDKDAEKDEESADIWQSLGIPKARIRFLGKEDNWWGPAGKTGPCGPDTEIFYWTSKNPAPKVFNPKDKNWVEIWNDVFMQYNKTEDGKYIPLKQKNVDTGMGVERMLAALNGLEDNYQTNTWTPIIKEIENLSKKKYEEHYRKDMRIIADHIRAAVLIMGDEKSLKPGNAEHGYVLRRLIRRAIRYASNLGIKDNFTAKLAITIIEIYKESYPEIKKNKNFILTQLEEEENKFRKTLESGIKEFEKVSKNKKIISGKEAFLLYQSYGFPIELTKELADEKKIKMDMKEYDKEFEKHQELSRKQSAGMFKSGLADSSKETTRLHTATHLLNEALRRILGPEVKQKGSNITPERLRFDFNFPRKLTEEEIRKVENLVNEKIKSGLEVTRTEESLQAALKSGAQAEFGQKYPEKVSVYTIIDKKEKSGFFSKELCTGPHVKNTKEIGKFKIIKEESSSAGVRRIKAVVEN